ERVAHFAQSGRHRHREYSLAQQAARIAAAADRHRRRAQGDQPLDLRSANRARYAGRIGSTAVRGRQGGSYASSWRILPTSRVIRLLHRVSKIHGNLSDPLGSRLDVWTSLSRSKIVHVPDVRADPDYVVLDRQFSVLQRLGSRFSSKVFPSVSSFCTHLPY